MATTTGSVISGAPSNPNDPNSGGKMSEQEKLLLNNAMNAVEELMGYYCDPDCPQAQKAGNALSELQLIETEE